MTNEQRAHNHQLRKARVLAFVTQDPPIPLRNLVLMEGLSERSLRPMIKQLEQEHGFQYFGTAAAKRGTEQIAGLTDDTSKLRARLGKELYRLTESDNEFGLQGREHVSPLVGLNTQQQVRAETAPWTHDWTLSQIERLARQLGEDPREFLIKCLKP